MRLALLACALAAAACHADEDEAWLRRADVPAGTRPVLAMLLDRSASAAAVVDAPATYDPGVDYGAGIAAEARCDAAGVFVRRGPGPAPDCPGEPALGALSCAAAHAPLAAYGFFVASPAIATECLAAHATPLPDAHVFFAGNYLNYLQSGPATAARPWSEAVAGALADALSATTGLDAALVATDDDSPGAGYVALAPTASEAAAARLRTIAATPATGEDGLIGSLGEAARWLRGDAVDSGTDGRADPLAQVAPGSGRYRSPFDSACHPVSLALLTANEAAAEAAGLAAGLAVNDLRDDLPGVQTVAVNGYAHADPLAAVNLVASALQHDAAVAADPQLSAAAFVPSDADARGPGVIFGLSAPRPRSRWLGNLFRYGLRAPPSPLEPPLVVDRDGEPAIDPETGLPLPISRSLWSDAPDADLLRGGATGRMPPGDARRILTDTGAAPELGSTLGDPGRHGPRVVVDKDAGRAIALAATQDGSLHAFDLDSGIEQWAWMPQDLVPRLAKLVADTPTFARSHGIDGSLVLHEREAGGHRWLLFGLGRGGARYYALDLARPDDPRLAWSFTLPDERLQARGEPVVTRLRISGSGQSAGDWVVLLPGGYDTRFDAPDATGAGAGGELLVLDAGTGRLLWSLDGFATLPSAPRALDLDGDGALDRAYVIDVTGNLWRIDFDDGVAAADLATARRIARLGTGTHRFFATPDVAVVQHGLDTRLAIAVGSGALTRPRDTRLVDRVYVVFDALAGDPADEVEEGDLFDATEAASALPPDARGWFARLEAHGAGEKVIGPAVSFDHALHFQTYQPLPPDPAAPCGASRAVARRYALDLRTALPRNTAAESADDESAEIAVSGLPPPLRFGFDTRWQEPCEGCGPRPFGVAGGRAFDAGYAGDPVRTSWRKLAPPPALP